MNCSALQLRAKNSILFGKWCMCRNNSECEWPSAAYGPKILNWEDFESCNVVVLAAAYIEMICRHYSSSRELYGLRRCIARVSFLPVTNHSMRDHIFLVLKSIFHWMGAPCWACFCHYCLHISFFGFDSVCAYDTSVIALQMVETWDYFSCMTTTEKKEALSRLSS